MTKQALVLDMIIQSKLSNKSLWKLMNMLKNQLFILNIVKCQSTKSSKSQKLSKFPQK